MKEKTTFYILNMYIWEITLKIACNYHLNRYLDLCSFQKGLYQRKTEVKREPIGDLVNPFNERKLNQCGHCEKWRQRSGRKCTLKLEER